LAWESRGFVSLYAFFTDGYEKRMYRNFDTPSDLFLNYARFVRL